MRSGGLLRLCHTNDCNLLSLSTCVALPRISHIPPIGVSSATSPHFEQGRGWPPRQVGASVRPVKADLSDDLGMRNPPRWRAVARPALAGLAPAGLMLIAVAMLPPVETLARRYLVVESVQFCLLSMAGPALIVLGAPWRLFRLSGGQAAEPADRLDQAGAHRGLADRLAARRLDRPSFVRAVGFGAWWVGVCVCWRLPPVLDVLARHPALILPNWHAVVRGNSPLARVGKFTAVDAAAFAAAARRHRGAGDVVHMGDRVRSRIRPRAGGSRLRRRGQFAGDGRRPGASGDRALAGGRLLFRSRHLRRTAHLAEGRRRCQRGTGPIRCPGVGTSAA